MKMTPEEIAAILDRHPGTVLVPVSIEQYPEAAVEWVECARFRLTPLANGLHELSIERRVREKVSA